MDPVVTCHSRRLLPSPPPPPKLRRMRHAAGDIGSCRLEGEGRARRLAVCPLDQVPGLVHAFTVAGSDAATVLHAIAGSSLPLWTLRQVHAAGVVQVEEGPAAPPDRPPEGDA